MLTVGEVAKRTKEKKERVRYFARKYNLQKIKIKNTESYLFDKDDLARFLEFTGKRKIKQNRFQLMLDFGEDFEKAFYKKSSVQKKELLLSLEAEIKKAKNKGITREMLKATLNINAKKLDRLIDDLTFIAPIAEDDRIDDRIYWVE